MFRRQFPLFLLLSSLFMFLRSARLVVVLGVGGWVGGSGWVAWEERRGEGREKGKGEREGA